MSSIIKQSHLLYQDSNPIKVSGQLKVSDLLSSDLNDAAKIENDMDNQFSSEDSLANLLENKLDDLTKKIKEAEERYEMLNKETDEILNRARMEAEDIKKEAHEKASQEGYQDGINSAIGEIENMKVELEQSAQQEIARAEEEKHTFISEIISKIPNAVAIAFKTLFNLEKVTNENLLLGLMLKGLGEISDEKEIRVLLSEEDYNMMDKKAFVEMMQKRGFDKEFSIAFDRQVKQGACLIETNLGFIDVNVDNALDDIMKNVSEAIHVEE